MGTNKKYGGYSLNKTELGMKIEEQEVLTGSEDASDGAGGDNDLMDSKDSMKVEQKMIKCTGIIKKNK